MKMWKQIAACAAAAALVGLTSACGGAPAKSAAQSAAPKSDKVVVYMPSPTGLANKLAEDFTKKTGIKVEQYQGTTGQILARLEAEKSRPVADVVILASWSDGMDMKAKGNLAAYEPKGADKLQAAWKDKDKMFYGTSASAVGVIYNTSVFSKLDADWEELASNPAYKDQMVIPDPKKSGSAKDFIDGFITDKGDNGWKVIQGLKDQGMQVRGANKAALDAVLTGEKGILIAGVDYNAFSSAKKGEPLAIYYPKGGTVVNPRPAMIMKTAPDMDNAKKFMDYLMSDDAQKLVVNAYLLPGRTDVKQDNRIPYDAIHQVKTDWDKMMKEAPEIMKKFASIMGANQ